MTITPNARLRAARAMLGIDKKTAAKELKIKYYTYNEIEQGRKDLTLKLLQKLKDRYSINPTWIMLGEGEIFC